METQGVENNADIDLFTDLTPSTEVQTSARTLRPDASFIQKCIHPPSAVPGYQGLPTNDTRSQVTPEWRGIYAYRPSYVWDNAGGAVVASAVMPNNIAMLSTNGARVNNYTFIDIGNGTYVSDYNNQNVNTNYNFANWKNDVNLYRPAYKSQTHYLNATMFNNTGMVSVAQFMPSILFAGTLLGMASKQPMDFVDFVVSQVQQKRASFVKQIDGKEDFLLVKSGPNNNLWNTNKRLEPAEALVPARHPYFCFPKYVRDEIHSKLQYAGLCTHANETYAIDLDPNTSIQVMNCIGIPFLAGPDVFPAPNISQEMQMSVRSYTGKALEGSFCVQRLISATPQWLTGTNTSIATADGLYLCYYAALSQTGVKQFIGLPDNCAIGTTSTNIPIMKDTLWSEDVTWAWTQYNGLTYQSVATAVNPQILQIKTYYGCEIQPCIASAWSAMMKLGPKPNLMAMQALMDAMYELKDGFPGRYNFWGVLGTLASTGLQTFGSSLLKGLTSGAKGAVKDTAEKVLNPKKTNTNKVSTKLAKQTARNKARKSGKKVAAAAEVVGEEAGLARIEAMLAKLLSKQHQQPNQQQQKQTKSKKPRARKGKNSEPAGFGG